MALRKPLAGFRLPNGEWFWPLYDLVNSITGSATPASPGNFTTGAFSGALAVGGVSSFAAGAAATPGLTFTGDTDTGFYRKAANQIGIAANGVEVGYFGSGVVNFAAAAFGLSSVDGGLVAAPGGTQAAALQLDAAVNVVVTVGTAADSVKLQAPTFIGQMVIVINAAAANSMQVFGQGTDTINGVATATGVAVGAGKMAIYVATSIGAGAAWRQLLSA